MGQVLVCFFILANVFAGAAMASTSSIDHERVQARIQPEVGASSPSPAQAPKKMPHMARKFGAPTQTQTLTPSSDHSDTNEHSTKGEMQSHDESPSQPHPAQESQTSTGSASAESKSGSEHHRPFDKSVAGGGVILGGLATTFLVAIFCYIRATTRRSKTAIGTAAQSPAHQLP